MASLEYGPTEFFGSATDDSSTLTRHPYAIWYPGGVDLARSSLRTTRVSCPVQSTTSLARTLLASGTLAGERIDRLVRTDSAPPPPDLLADPRVAFVSFSTFGYPVSERASKMHEAPKVLDGMKVDFEYEGEMTVDVALNPDVMAQYPFCRLSGPANILVVPARHSASISVKLMQEMAGATVIGPILTGVTKPIQICSTNSTVNDILNMAVMAACKVG